MNKSIFFGLGLRLGGPRCKQIQWINFYSLACYRWLNTDIRFCFHSGTNCWRYDPHL